MSKQVYEKTKSAGVYKQHARGCPGGKCKCAGTFQATVYSAREDKKIRKTFETQREAELWRGEMRSAVDRGEVKAPTRQTVGEAMQALLAGIKDGTITTRSGRRYRPSTIRRYELAWARHLKRELAHKRLTDVDRATIKALVADCVRASMPPSTIRNTLDPLRVLIREAIEVGALTVDPMAGMKLPAGQGRRERVADRAEAQALIDALPASEQALWACAFYGGLRRGELQALRWTDVDFEKGAVRVERGWDQYAGAQEPKTAAGARSVPLAGILRRHLAEHKLRSRWSGDGDALVFGRTATQAFLASTVRARALTAWKRTNERRVKAAEQAGEAPESVVLLAPITLHEARHSAASYLIEAGLNDLELTAMIGHSDPRTTKAIYGHLFPDSPTVVAAKLDAYLEAASSD